MQIIEEYDNEILQHLQDIFVVEFSEPKIGYRLVFVFGKNDFFKNEVGYLDRWCRRSFLLAVCHSFSARWLVTGLTPMCSGW